jgi:hypothetical protein
MPGAVEAKVTGARVETTKTETSRIATETFNGFD